MALERDIATGGTGSIYLASYGDEYFRPGMTLDEAEVFALRAVNHATIRDGYSGGPIQIVRVTIDGATRKWYMPDKQPLDVSIVKT
jgi:20S proteasome alpha/beta subunit